MELIRTETGYVVVNTPFYGTVGLTHCSEDWPASLHAFEFANKNGRLLQGLGHAIVAMVAFNKEDKISGLGLDGSNDYQKTSTISLKFNDGKNIVTAFVELENDGQSLALVQEGCYAERNGRELFKPLDDPFISRLILLARENDRICPALSERILRLSTIQKGGRSAYGLNRAVIAAIGSNEITELNAEYLQERLFENGHFYDFDESRLEKLLDGKEGHALIRPVGLGGGDFNDVHYINASSLFNYPGRARGIFNSTKSMKNSGDLVVTTS